MGTKACCQVHLEDAGKRFQSPSAAEDSTVARDSQLSPSSSASFPTHSHQGVFLKMQLQGSSKSWSLSLGPPSTGTVQDLLLVQPPSGCHPLYPPTGTQGLPSRQMLALKAETSLWNSVWLSMAYILTLPPFPGWDAQSWAFSLPLCLPGCGGPHHPTLTPV